MYKIYMHRNKINQKTYIGITRQNLTQRWNNGKGYAKQPKFFRAIQKYGWHNFEHLILEECETEEEALEIEAYFIEKYNSINNGYNILPKGIQSASKLYCKPVYCLTTKKLYPSIKQAAEENDISGAYCIISNCKGKSGPIKGLDWTYWDKEKQCPIEKTQFVKKLPNNAESIYCIELNTIFPSISATEREFNLAEGTIAKVVNNHRNGAAGLHFIKVKNIKDINLKNILKQRTGKTRKIICLENNKVFSSVQKAGIFCERSAQSVTLNCQGKRQICGKYHFQFFEDYIDQHTLEEIQQLDWREFLYE